MEMQNWLLFSSIALVATVSPGPAVFLVISHSLRYGSQYAILTILGNISGLFIMSLLSVLGLSALIRYSETGFVLLKTIGVFFLIYLGLRLITSKAIPASLPAISKSSLSGRKKVQLYLQGLLVALSNPKAIGFTTALFPQFIDNQQPLTGQFTILVITFMAFSFFCLLTYALLSELGTRSFFNQHCQRTARQILGFLLIASGVGLGLSS